MLPNLKYLRAKRGISQQRLADAISLTQQSINQYENHKIEPDIHTLCLIADYFDTSVDFLVGHEVNSKDKLGEATHLSAEEADLVTKYRALNPKERDCITQMLAVLLEK